MSYTKQRENLRILFYLSDQFYLTTQDYDKIKQMKNLSA